MATRKALVDTKRIGTITAEMPIHTPRLGWIRKATKVGYGYRVDGTAESPADAEAFAAAVNASADAMRARNRAERMPSTGYDASLIPADARKRHADAAAAVPAIGQYTLANAIARNIGATQSSNGIAELAAAFAARDRDASRKAGAERLAAVLAERAAAADAVEVARVATLLATSGPAGVGARDYPIAYADTVAPIAAAEDCAADRAAAIAADLRAAADAAAEDDAAYAAERSAEIADEDGAAEDGAEPSEIAAARARLAAIVRGDAAARPIEYAISTPGDHSPQQCARMRDAGESRAYHAGWGICRAMAAEDAAADAIVAAAILATAERTAAADGETLAADMPAEQADFRGWHGPDGHAPADCATLRAGGDTYGWHPDWRRCAEPAAEPAADAHRGPDVAAAHAAMAAELAPMAAEPVAADPGAPAPFDTCGACELRPAVSPSGLCAECLDAADAAETPAPSAEPTPMVAPSAERPTCGRCGQTFRKSGNGYSWHVANRPDCATRSAAA